MLAKPAFATCPVCLVAVGSGLWLAEWLGVDDLIAALWIGALSTALAFWFAKQFKLIKLPYPEISWSLISYLSVLAFFQAQGKLWRPYCQIWGICKLFLGVTLGMLVFWLGVFLDRQLRRLNQGSVFFPFQKVVLPVVAVVITSLIFQLIL